MKKYYIFFVFLVLLVFPLSSSKAQYSVYGDVNSDGSITVSDVVYLINYLFKDGTPPDPTFIGDANGDDRVTVSDVVYLVNYLFKGGTPPKNFLIPPDSSEIDTDTNGVTYIINRVNIAFQEGTDKAKIDSTIVAITGVLEGECKELWLYQVKVSNVDATLEILAQNPYVQFATRAGGATSFMTKVNVLPSDPWYLTWQRPSYNQLRMPLAWEIAQDPVGVKICVLDDGVWPHEDLDQNLATDCERPVKASDQHGLMVSGVIAAISNNQKGGVGVVRNTKLSVYAVYPNDFATANKLQFLGDLSQKTGKHIVVNISFGFHWKSAGCVLQKGISYALARNVLIVAAAGNVNEELWKKSLSFWDCVLPPNSAESHYDWPQSFPGVLAVGESDWWDQNPGERWGDSVIAAPWMLFHLLKNNQYDIPNPPNANIGTSFTAPVVAGVASLVWSIRPDWSLQQVKNCILASADTVSTAFKQTFGYGKINAYRALKLAQGISTNEDRFPASPQWAAWPGTGGDKYVALYWQPPSNNYDGTPFEPGDYIAGYTVYRKPSSQMDTAYHPVASLGGGSYYWIDKNVSNGTSYDYRISCMDGLWQESYWTDPVKTFTPSPIYNYISGFVRDNYGNPMPGVTLTVTGQGSANYLTDNNGFYLMHLGHGINWTITPSKSGYTFNPPSLSYPNLAQNWEFQNYTGTVTSYYYIKGYVKDNIGNGLNGVTVTLSGGKSDTYVTGSTGYYEFLNLQGGLNYTVTPTKSGWVFSPPNLNYTPLSSNQDSANFTGTTFYYIKGFTRDLSGIGIDSVWVELSGDTTAYYRTQSNGYYEFLNIRSGRNYSVRPSKVGWSFSPESRPYNPLASNIDSANFTGTPLGLTYYIKGYVRDLSSNGIPNVTVTLSGGATGNYITGSDGYYEFLNLPSYQNYTVTPGKSCWTFSPTSQNIYLNSNKDSTNFAGTPLPNYYYIKGFVRDSTGVGIESTTVSLTGGSSGNYVTDTSGYYEFLSLQGGFDYTVTPNKTELSFIPLSRFISGLCANQESQNYVGVPTPPSTDFKVSGDPTGTSNFPSISANNVGSFVVTWEDRRYPEPQIYAQKYVSIAQPVGSNFKVNDDGTTWGHSQPQVAITTNGSLDFTWRDHRSDYNPKIYSQRYDSSGSTIGSNFRVDTDPSKTSNKPDITVEGSGKFIIVWEDRRDGIYSVYLQRYDSSGTALGANTKVNDDATPTEHIWAKVDATSDGRFVICWMDGREYTYYDKLYCQRYNASGVKQGSNFKVSSGADSVIICDVAVDGNANFVVVWEYMSPSGKTDIYARRYNSSGSPLGSPFKVNDDASIAWHGVPSVAMTSTGNFVVIWVDYRNGNADIYAQRYNSSGSPIGSNFKVNDDTGSAEQAWPDVAVNGSYIYMTWKDSRTSGQGAGIYARVIPWVP